jgi:hypothetical protein
MIIPGTKNVEVDFSAIKAKLKDQGYIFDYYTEYDSIGDEWDHRILTNKIGANLAHITKEDRKSDFFNKGRINNLRNVIKEKINADNVWLNRFINRIQVVYFFNVFTKDCNSENIDLINKIGHIISELTEGIILVDGLIL